LVVAFIPCGNPLASRSAGIDLAFARGRMVLRGDADYLKAAVDASPGPDRAGNDRLRDDSADVGADVDTPMITVPKLWSETRSARNYPFTVSGAE